MDNAETQSTLNTKHSRMDNAETQSTLNTKHRMKTNNNTTKKAKKMSNMDPTKTNKQKTNKKQTKHKQNNQTKTKPDAPMVSFDK
jgi:hypothetical protein